MVKITLVLVGLMLLIGTASAADYSASDVASDAVASGCGKFFKGLVDGMYEDFESNQNVTDTFGSPRSALFTVITHVPNPYDDPQIKALYSNYYNLALYFIALFILGEFINRNLARTKMTENVFGTKDLSTSNFVGGVTMCFIGLFSNFAYMGLLEITEKLSQFTMFSVMDSIAPNPDNLVTYIGMGVCDAFVFAFFIIRYIVIYAFAVVCTIVVVLAIPKASRGFSFKTVKNLIRILALQPVAIFATCIGILALKTMPVSFQAFGYIGLTIFVFLVCWYVLFSNFDLLEKGAKVIISKGVAL